ncbi:tetratricopeptide repeat protein [Paenisporosarcina sp. NPDC076898]|uniref:tetratricopeptide repeat protein n=1 Tax=unclassified Paenisporosarcina TaxID=2642018 RepID=UPI003CFD0247
MEMEISQQFIEAIEAGDLQAVQSLIETLQLSSEPDAQYEIANMLVQAGYLKEGEQVLEHLQFLFPEEAQLKIDRAQVLMEIDEEDEALLLLTSIEEHEEEYPQALLSLADYYQMQGFYESAEQKINQALAILPGETLLIFAKAELLLETGKYLEAARLYENLKNETDEIAGIRLSERLAEVYSAGAAYEDAIPFYEESLVDHVTPDLLFGYAYAAFQAGQYDLSVRKLNEVKTLDPDYFSAHLLLSQAYSMLEDHEQAYQAILEGLSRDEYDKELYLFAGKMALKLGKVVEAEQHLRQAIALDPEYMEATLTLVSYLHAEERDQDVIELIEIISQNQDDWSALYPFAAEAYAKEENFERAYDFYSLAYTDHKEDPLFMEKYVYFLLEEGKREEALEIGRQLVLLQPHEERWQDLIESLS